MPTREERISNLKKANDESHRNVVISLKEALYGLLKKKDIKDITVTELIKAAGVSRGVFYKYYYLVSDVLLEDIRELSQMVNANIGNDLHQNWLIIFRTSYDNRETISLLLKANMGMELLKQLNQFADEHKGYEDIMRMWYGIIFNAIVTWSERDFKETPEAYAAIYTKMTSPIFDVQ